MYQGWSLKHFERSKALDTALSYYKLEGHFSNRPSDRAHILIGCEDIGHISSHLNKLTHPTPGGFRGLPIHCACVRLFVPCPYLHASVLSSYYILDRRTAPSDRTVPKFGTHVRIVSLTLKKTKNLTHPTRGVVVWVAAVYVSLTYFGTRPSDRAQIWLACADRYSHLKKKLTHPTPGGGVLGGYILLKIFRDGSRPNFARMCG